MTIKHYLTLTFENIFDSLYNLILNGYAYKFIPTYSETIVDCEGIPNIIKISCSSLYDTYYIIISFDNNVFFEDHYYSYDPSTGIEIRDWLYDNIDQSIVLYVSGYF